MGSTPSPRSKPAARWHAWRCDSQPFWMLPTLAILGLKARDIMGYTFTMFLACFPAALIAVALPAPHVTS